MNRSLGIVILLALVTTAAAAAAAPPAVGPAVSTGDPLAELRHLHVRLLLLPLWSGAVLVLAGILPLFFGWLLVRVCTAGGCAVAAAGGCLTVLAGEMNQVLLWSLAGVAALMAALIGWFMYQIIIALKGAFLVGVLLLALAQALTPGDLTAPWPQVILVAAALLGAGLGGVLGWRLAPWVAMVETGLIGAALMSAGVIALVKPSAPQTALIAGLVCLAILALLGWYVQFRRERNRV